MKKLTGSDSAELTNFPSKFGTLKNVLYAFQDFPNAQMQAMIINADEVKLTHGNGNYVIEVGNSDIHIQFQRLP